MWKWTVRQVVPEKGLTDEVRWVIINTSTGYGTNTVLYHS